MPAYYNENDSYAAQWLKNLIQKQLITSGEVDERPIQDVKPSDLTQFTRCHFFAGVAGWELALANSNWPTDKPVWTGSCPCQPFSTAGARLGFADERHLWPYWFHLIKVCRPPTVFGEQVANGSGPWLDLVLADLEGADYAVGAAVLPAAGVGAPHIRDRVFLVAESQEWALRSGNDLCEGQSYAGVGDAGEDASDPDSLRPSLGRESQLLGQRAPSQRSGAGVGAGTNVGNSARDGERWQGFSETDERRSIEIGGPGWWDVEPGLGRVVDGFPTRAQRLRAYGNAIVPQAAQVFIEAYLKCRP